MFHRKRKTGYFLLEGLNSLATAYYFYYLFFYMRQQFKFGSAENLALAALHGFVYMFAARVGGNVAQSRGYFFALRVGFIVMAGSLTLGSLLSQVAGQVAVLAVWTIGVCFTWPTLEALVSEKETPAGLRQMVGLYNLVWAGSSAVAYFIGGTLFEKLGAKSLFLLPAMLHVIQLAMTFWLEHRATPAGQPPCLPAAALEIGPRPEAVSPSVSPKTFLRLAWVANPFAYVAINAAMPVIPELALKLSLSPMYAGFFCSVWFFARFAAFIWLWWWPGWHYRFDLLLGVNILMVISFAAMLLAAPFGVILLAQIFFGLSLGLIYYSSLFYSMDVGETKGEHGGVHESAIGTGIFAGSAVGAASRHFFPQHAGSSTLAVSGLLVLGIAAILVIKRRS